MPIKQRTDQNRLTLAEYYAELADGANEYYKGVSSDMIKLVQMINNTLKDTILWGFTSHDVLVLQSKDGWESDSYITISSDSKGRYNFEYRMPEENSPWPSAWVKGSAKNLEEAKSYLLISMDRSRSWTDSKELEKLLKDNGLK